jgi:hypothetical protein
MPNQKPKPPPNIEISKSPSALLGRSLAIGYALIWCMAVVAMLVS